MSSSFKTSPTGHPSGRTALAAHSGSTTLFTGGADGWVRSWAAQTMLDKKDLYEADQGDLQVVSLGFCPPRSLLVGLERDEMDGQVRLVDCDTGALVTNVTKTPLGVRDVAASADGKWAAVATERSGLRIVDLSNVAEVHSREDHMGAVKGVSFDSQTEWLASMGADGTLKLWACGRQFELVHSLPVCERDDAMVKGSDAGRGTRKPAWSPRGDLLAVGVGAHRGGGTDGGLRGADRCPAP
jgi:WD40 repeat protein